MKILIADEDNLYRLVLSQLLYDDGYDVISTHTSGRAWEYLRRETPDICIFDAGLPGIHGMSMAERIRADGELRRLPVILLSAGAAAVPENLRAAADFFVKKSAEADKVVPLIEELLGKISGERSG
ncbi:MAG: response regulator [Elusimicrobiales bacterium]|nr:response regulator [Elusimicrobiales bacterium]